MFLLKNFVLVLVSLLLHNALAVEVQTMNINNVELSIKNDTSKSVTAKQKQILKNQIIHNQKFVNSYINKLKINLLINKNSNEISLSNGNPYECSIELSYKDLNKPVLLLDMDTDILFTILHETAHCILTKDIMYQKMVWHNIPREKQKQLQSLIDRQESSYLHHKVKVPPMLVFHEIFADTFSAIILKNNTDQFNNNLIRLIKMRDSKKYDKQESHLSSEALKIVKQLDLHDHKLKIEDIYDIAIKISQKAFIAYLNEQEANLKK